MHEKPGVCFTASAQGHANDEQCAVLFSPLQQNSPGKVQGTRPHRTQMIESEQVY